jgi:DUF1680 family protein
MHKDAAVIVDTRHSPHARLRPLPLTAVQLHDDFWQPRRQINRQVTLPAQYRFCQETGRIDNFRRAASKIEGTYQGIFFNDSDIYKWLEAAAWNLATDDDPALGQLVDQAISEVEAAQQPDGYLNTYFMFEKEAERWTNLRDMHELYCAGHLIQAAVAHYRASGSQRLLQVASRLADHLDTRFGPGKQPGTPGHEEIEMALVELARTTGETRYLELAKFFIDQRGQGLIGGGKYHQDHKPLSQMERMVGHAVRAVYLNCGVVDVLAESANLALRQAQERLWHNMTERQMYISGGIGSRYQGEAFGQDYELPNARAYAESCAAIGSFMWNWRLLLLDGESRFADLMEQTLYNGILAGLSLDGQSYFYQNPLADEGSHRRQPWFGCACCPPNLARLLASLPGYYYTTSTEGIWVHLYGSATASFDLPALNQGRPIQLQQQTNYPWDGDIRIQVEGRGDFSLYLRLPGWCAKPQLQVNGQRFAGALAPGSYARIQREWYPGDVVQLQLPMPVQAMVAHPYVIENNDRLALQRGPLLYCVEQSDHPDSDIRHVRVSPQVGDEAQTAFQPDLLGGIMTIRLPGIVAKHGWEKTLYHTVTTAPGPGPTRTISLTAVPYYAWANREPGPMRVWLPCQ